MLNVILTLLAIMLITIIVSLMSAFAVLFLSKFPKPIKKDSLRDYVVMRAPRLVSNAFECDFCLCFWVSLAISIIVAAILSNAIFIVCAMPATTLARFLL